MPVIVKEPKGGQKHDPIPAGMHHGICYAIVDIGTQPQTGKYPSRRKVIVSWELPDIRIELERDGKKESLPRVISKRYGFNLSDRGNLRPMLEAWRGRKFTQEELDGFDLEKLVGVNCLLNVIHEQGRNDPSKTYEEVQTVNPLPKAMPKRDLENQPLVWFMDNYEEGSKPAFPENMPEWMQKLVMQSGEWHLLASPKVERNDGPKQAFPTDNDEKEDDLPF